MKRFHAADISYFYPRSPCGERLVLACLAIVRLHFYPRSPCGERPDESLNAEQLLPISIHALLAESDMSGLLAIVNASISIHALLAESDAMQIRLEDHSDISIHALLAESDRITDMRLTCIAAFLSTLSLRRATTAIKASYVPLDLFLSTLSLRRATIVRYRSLFSVFYFYPRSPCGERPDLDFPGCGAADISIHALLAESDLVAPCFHILNQNFYPRSPCGERRVRLRL